MARALACTLHFALLLNLGFQTTGANAQSSPQRTQSVPTESQAAEDLATTVRIDHRATRVGKNLVLLVLIQNLGSDPVFAVNLEWETNSALDLTWVEPPGGPRPTVLRPGQQILSRARLTARKATDEISPILLLNWKRQPKGPVHTRFVSVPTLEIKALPSWLLPTAIPALGALFVALLGWGFTHRLERQKQHQATFLSMQSTVLEIARSHYLPIGSAVRTLGDHLALFDRAKTAKDEFKAYRTLSLAFASFVLLHHRDYQLTQKVGGWVLLDRLGEETVDALWECFKDGVLERFDKIELGKIIDQVGASPTFSGMIAQFEGIGPADENSGRERWREFRDIFRKWIEKDRASFDNRMVALKAFVAVLQLETNRFYAPLYGPKDRFPGPDEAPAVENLIAQSDALNELKENTAFSAAARTLELYCKRLSPPEKAWIP